MQGHSTGQEYILKDADVTIRKPTNISLQKAATMRVTCETACLGVEWPVHSTTGSNEPTNGQQRWRSRNPAS